MSALSIQVPFPVFQDRDGQPLDNGYVWLGTSSLNPQTNPIACYYDAALTIAATQPLRTLNGFISRAGSPAQVYVDAVNFSILVQDSKGTTVFSVPEGTGISPNASGVVYDPAGTGAVATTVQAKLRESVSVKDFGAVGNGTTDDTAAIQAALNTGLSVFVPPTDASYKTTSALLPADGQIFFGVGAKSKIICSGVATNAISISGKTQVSICDLQIVYSGTSSGGTTGASVFIGGGSSNCSVSRNYLTASRAGVTISAADDNTVDSNAIISTTLTYPEQTWDIGVYLGGSRNKIVSNSCQGGGYLGIQVLSDPGHNCYKNIISGNIVGGHTGYGIIAYADSTGKTENTVISNNQIYDITGSYEPAASRSKGSGIYIASANFTTIIGNSIENVNVNTDLQVLAPGAIGVLDCSGAVVTGNILELCNWFGVYLVGDGADVAGCIVANNLISSVTKSGVYVLNKSQVNVSGNSLKAVTDTGVLVVGSATQIGIQVTGNSVVTADRGVQVNSVIHPVVSANIAQNCTTGYYFESCTGATVANNVARNNLTIDFYFAAANSEVIQFDGNSAVSAAATYGVQDLYGIAYGVNESRLQTNPWGTATKLERRLTVSATPSVKGSRLADNNGAASVTDLLDPIDGQVLTICANNAITLVNDGGAATTKLMLAGGVNFVMAAQNTCTLIYRVGGPWTEIGRKV